MLDELAGNFSLFGDSHGGVGATLRSRDFNSDVTHLVGDARYGNDFFGKPADDHQPLFNQLQQFQSLRSLPSQLLQEQQQNCFPTQEQRQNVNYPNQERLQQFGQQGQQNSQQNNGQCFGQQGGGFFGDMQTASRQECDNFNPVQSPQQRSQPNQFLSRKLSTLNSLQTQQNAPYGQQQGQLGQLQLGSQQGQPGQQQVGQHNGQFGQSLKEHAADAQSSPLQQQQQRNGEQSVNRFLNNTSNVHFFPSFGDASSATGNFSMNNNNGGGNNGAATQSNFEISNSSSSAFDSASLLQSQRIQLMAAAMMNQMMGLQHKGFPSVAQSTFSSPFTSGASSAVPAFSTSIASASEFDLGGMTAAVAGNPRDGGFRGNDSFSTLPLLSSLNNGNFLMENVMFGQSLAAASSPATAVQDFIRNLSDVANLPTAANPREKTDHYNYTQGASVGQNLLGDTRAAQGQNVIAQIAHNQQTLPPAHAPHKISPSFPPPGSTLAGGAVFHLGNNKVKLENDYDFNNESSVPQTGDKADSHFGLAIQLQEQQQRTTAPEPQSSYAPPPETGLTVEAQHEDDATGSNSGGDGDGSDSATLPLLTGGAVRGPRPHGSSRYGSQKRRDWNTFGQYLRNHRPPIQITKCTPQQVVEFLRYLDQFGKTKVHDLGCEFYGTHGTGHPCSCPLKQAWGSLDSLIGRLRAAYEENGGRAENNPFGARIVRAYLRETRDHQAKARGIAYEKKRRKKHMNALVADPASEPNPPEGLD